MAVVTAHVTQLRAMLAFERSLVDRVGPPGCAARETAAANVAALEWVLDTLGYLEAVNGGPLGLTDAMTVAPVFQGSPDAWDRSRVRYAK